MRASIAASIVLATLCAVACDVAQHSQRARRVEGVGVVESIDAPSKQVVIDHEDIPGVMPAMSMSFDIGDPRLLETLAPGQKIAFTLELRKQSLRVVEARVLEESGSAGRSGPVGAAAFSRAVDEAQPAPDFSLVDQDGRTVSLASLRGSVVLLDFVYTHCPGPCPILTSRNVSVQKKLPPELAAKVRFVSISLDPARDTPEALRAYATARGADLARWSFLTGEPGAVIDVLERYGVGAKPGANGEIDHLVVTYVIDAQGRVARRFGGLEHPADVLVAALGTVATAG
jgi:protein SCO1/2